MCVLIKSICHTAWITVYLPSKLTNRTKHTEMSVWACCCCNYWSCILLDPPTSFTKESKKKNDSSSNTVVNPLGKLSSIFCVLFWKHLFPTSRKIPDELLCNGDHTDNSIRKTNNTIGHPIVRLFGLARTTLL